MGPRKLRVKFDNDSVAPSGLIIIFAILQGLAPLPVVCRPVGAFHAQSLNIPMGLCLESLCEKSVKSIQNLTNLYNCFAGVISHLSPLGNQQPNRLPNSKILTIREKN